MSKKKPEPVQQPAKLTLIQAIARHEGFLKEGSRAQRNHNPGNLNWGKFAEVHGGLRADDKGYAIFPDDQVGYAALVALLKTSRYRGKTLVETMNIYCPPTGDVRGDNDTPAYVRNITSWTGIQPAEVIDPHVA